MRCTVVAVVVALAALVAAGPVIDSWDTLALEAREKQKAFQHLGPSGGDGCNSHNAAVRREWGSLSKSERHEYIDAVQCLAATPSKFGPDFAPGARNRIDDFVATHINQTLYIHGTGSFLAWHRYFVWAYEKALRDECGYTGYQPYWAWNKYAENPQNSPSFDGSPYSLSGNGDYFPHDGPVWRGVQLPAGTGGGCVTSGPFTNWTINLGPVAPQLKVPGQKIQHGSGLEYNPRCLRRDINTEISSQWMTTNCVMETLSQPDIKMFQEALEGLLPDPAHLGIHNAGHYVMGGDPGADLFVSPGDPAFFFHHAALDRLFWTWQNQDPLANTYVVHGGTFMPEMKGAAINDVSRPATLDDVVDIGSVFSAPPRTIRELLGTTDGALCYVYL